MSLVVIQMWPNSPVWRTQYNGSYIDNNVLVSLKHIYERKLEETSGQP